MTVEGLKLSAGPRSRPGDVDVHILYVPPSVIAAEGCSGDDVSAIALQSVAKHVGTPRPHDIIVFAGQPFHFVNGALHDHASAHRGYRETVLQLHRRREERAVWWSERPFAITRIDPELPMKPGAADAPFATPKTETDDQGIYFARSDVPAEEADDQMYKITFTIEGEPKPIDPHMYCSPAR
jgi:hypothetical protein